MSHGKRFGAPAALAAIVFSVFLFSCSDDMEGVFYSLEIEEKAADNSLPNALAVSGDIIKVTAGGGITEDRYYIGAGSVFYRAASGGAWARIPPPFRGGMVAGIARAGSDIFVAVSDGSRHGLFKLDAAGTAYVPGSLYSDKQIQRLMSVNDTLFAAVGSQQGLNRDLLYWDGAALVSTGLSGHTVEAGAWDGTAYWFVGKNVFRYTGGPGNGSSTPYSHSELSGKTGFSDIFADAGTVYICTSGGDILKTPDSGVNWTSHYYSRNFTSIAKVTSGGESIIILGEDGDGVFELTDRTGNDVAAGIHQPGGNFRKLPDLYRSTVLRLLGDGTQLLAGTSSVGAWRGDYTIPDYPVWSQE